MVGGTSVMPAAAATLWRSLVGAPIRCVPGGSQQNPNRMPDAQLCNQTPDNQLCSHAELDGQFPAWPASVEGASICGVCLNRPAYFNSAERWLLPVLTLIPDCICFMLCFLKLICMPESGLINPVLFTRPHAWCCYCWG